MTDSTAGSYTVSELVTDPGSPVSPGDILVFGGLGLLVGLILFFNGFRLLKKSRLVKDTPTSKIRSLAMGRAEVFGTIVPFQEITMAPFSGTPCVYFRYSLEKQYERRDKQGRVHEEWRQIDSGRWSVPFFVQDETGKVLVDPKNAEVDTPADRANMPILGLELPPNILARTSPDRHALLRYSESYIRPDEQLYVLGFAGDNPHIADTSQDTAAGDKMIQYRDGEPFFVSSQHQEAVATYSASAGRQSIVAGAILAAAGLIAAIYASTL